MSEHLNTEQLYALLDDEVGGSERAQQQGHLDQCARCQQEMHRVEALFTAIESAPAPALARDLAGPVMAELERLERSASRLPLWLAAQGLIAAGVVAAWLSLQPGRASLVGGLQDEIDLLFWWSQWALPRVSDLRLLLITLSDQAAGWLAAVDVSVLWAPAAGWPWVPIIAGLLVLWLASNGLLLRPGRDRG